ncbi:DEAD-box ATP-dependent RNA helicase 7 [Tanacetum coccineum]
MGSLFHPIIKGSISQLYGCTQNDVERGPLLRLGSGARIAAMSANPMDLLQVSILDEADEMLRQGFVEDVEYILGNSGVAITLYEPRKANISKLEREVVKLEHVSAPQLSDIARAAGLDAAEAILRVSDRYD